MHAGGLLSTKKTSFLHSLVQVLGKFEEFSTVMPTLDCVLALHNCFEFSQLPSCLDETVKTQKKSSTACLGT